MDGSITDEAGSTDNRLSWSPAEFPDTKDWKDGAEYTVTLRIQQTAPGEAKVVSMTGEPVTEEEPVPGEGGGVERTEEGGPAQAVASADNHGGGMQYANPAMRKLMSGSRA